MKTISATLKDEHMIVFTNQQKRRYGSYASFIRALIIDRMDNRNSSDFGKSPVYRTKKSIDNKPMPYIKELKMIFELRRNKK